MRHSKPAATFLVLMPVLVIGPSTSAQETEQPAYEPVGQVELSRAEIGFLISVGGGRGILKFQDHEYPFRIGGLGVGGTGVHRVNVSGDVYNLQNVSDFEGRYAEVRGGVTLGSLHRGARQLKNSDRDVYMTLWGTAEGVRLNLGADNVRITLE